jgi:predicted nucleic acid-binding protein
MAGELIDSNVIIYAALPENSLARDFIRRDQPTASVISYVEALGFHKLTEPARVVLQHFFSRAKLWPIDQPVLDRAVALRQQRRMSLGDGIIAATALVHDLTLVTRNVDDFRWITGLRLLNPFDAQAPPAASPPPAPPAGSP